VCSSIVWKTIIIYFIAKNANHLSFQHAVNFLLMEGVASMLVAVDQGGDC
jgi:hypothetical protein